MKKVSVLWFLIFFISCSPQYKQSLKFKRMYSPKKNISIYDVSVDLYDEIEHLGEYSNIKLTTSSGENIYIDPVKIPDKKDADIIFITHTHYDHFNIRKIKQLMKETTIFCITKDAYRQRKDFFENVNTIIVEPNGKYTVGGFEVETFPAYNKHAHPESRDWVGYVITINGRLFYISGDTDFISEMQNIHPDAVFLCTGGDAATAFFNDGIYEGLDRGMMNGEEAARAVNAMKPEYAFPIHSFWCATDCDLNSFMENVDKDIKVIIQKPESE